MKLKCPDCGEKEMELMSKGQIVLNNFASAAVFTAVLAIVKEWVVPSKYVCRNCGYMKDA